MKRASVAIEERPDLDVEAFGSLVQTRGAYLRWWAICLPPIRNHSRSNRSFLLNRFLLNWTVLDKTFDPAFGLLAQHAQQSLEYAFLLLGFIAEGFQTAGVGELGHGEPDAERPEVAVRVANARSVGGCCGGTQRRRCFGKLLQWVFQI